MLLSVLMLIAAAPRPAPPPPPAPPVASPHGQAEMINLGEIFTEANYPFWAMRDADEGLVRFRVAVDAAGTVTACDIMMAAESESLNQGTCALLMTQARFRPARDRRGRPIASIYSRQVRWQLENRDPFPVADGHDRVLIRFSTAGVEDCRIEGTPGREIDPRSCEFFRVSPRMTELAILARQPADPMKLAARELVIDDSDFLDPAAAATVGLRPGEQLIDRTRLLLTISPAGAVIGCEIVESGQASEQGMQISCERTAKVMFAASSDTAYRRLTMVSALYTRPRQ